MIIIKRKDGGVSILLPTSEATPETILRDIKRTEGYVSHREVDVKNIPTDRTFRDAWTDDNPTETVDVDMPKAREIHKEHLRIERKPLLEQLDIEYQKADEVKNEKKKAEIASKKQELRDITKHPDIEKAQTPEELKLVKI